jgi:hypothetical protein
MTGRANPEAGSDMTTLVIVEAQSPPKLRTFDLMEG